MRSFRYCRTTKTSSAGGGGRRRAEVTAGIAPARPALQQRTTPTTCWRAAGP